MTEEWRDIPGYEDRYQVSDQGRVRSLDRYVRAVSKAGREYQRKVAGVILAPGNSRGYLIVNLHPTGTVAVHLLVARVFVPGYGEGLQANHIDGIKANCAARNLEWVSVSRNQTHAVALGLKSQAVKVTDGKSYWPSQAQAAFDIVGKRRRGSEISRVLRGERDLAFGRTWSAVA